MGEKKIKQNKYKKLWIGLVVTISICALVSAAWLFTYNFSGEARITSVDGVQQISISFPQMSLDTTVNSDYSETNASFVYNKDSNFTVIILQTIGDNSAGNCTGAENDCIVKYWFQSGLGNPDIEIYNGKQIHAEKTDNLRGIKINMTCVSYSCPQTRFWSIKLNELPTGAT